MFVQTLLQSMHEDAICERPSMQILTLLASDYEADSSTTVLTNCTG